MQLFSGYSNFQQILNHEGKPELFPFFSSIFCSPGLKHCRAACAKMMQQHVPPGPPPSFPLREKLCCGQNSRGHTWAPTFFQGGSENGPQKNNTTNNGYRGGDTFGRTRGGVEDRGERGAGKTIFYKKSGKIVKKKPLNFFPTKRASSPFQKPQ